MCIRDRVCSVVSRGDRPLFFEDERGTAVTVTSESYVNLLEIFLAPRLHTFPNLDIQHTWFQQDGATSHLSLIHI